LKSKASRLDLLFEQIAPYQCLHQFIPIQLTNHAARIVVVGDIGGIFRQQVTNDLVNGVVTLFTESIEHTPENSAHILSVIIGNGELNGTVVRHGNDLLSIIGNIIS
jgi:hypothetical protein